MSAGTALDRPTNLADHAADAHLREHGYVVLDRVLPSDVVRDLSDLYEGVIAEVGRDRSGSFLPSMMIRTAHLRARLWDGVRSLVEPYLAPAFTPGTTEVFGGSFVSKPGGPASVRRPHQDPTVFDESRVRSLSVWTPLTASTVANGTLRVLPGSHRMGNHVRPPDVESFDDEVASAAWAESVPLELGPGELLVLDGELVHHSPPNDSGQERVAAICAIRAPGEAMRVVRSDGGARTGTATVYEVDLELYRSGDLVDPDLSSAHLVGQAPYRPATLHDLRASQRGG